MVHYGTAAAAGVLYAVAVPSGVRARPWSGLLFGVAVWAIGNELFLPAIGLEKKPAQYSGRMQAQGIGEHIAYGLTLQMFDRCL
jgi:uncharacterized membrane protein YagU involved in acid resistance